MTRVNRILLVDDDPTTNFLNRTIINELGICENLSIAKDGFSALEMIKKSTFTTNQPDSLPDMIICDIRMPGMDGFELLQKLKELTVLERVVVCMLTGSFNTRDRIRVHSDRSVHAFMYKPLDPSELLKIVSSHFNREPNLSES